MNFTFYVVIEHVSGVCYFDTENITLESQTVVFLVKSQRRHVFSSICCPLAIPVMFATLPDNCQTIPEVDSDDDDSPVLPPGTHKCSESTETSEVTGQGVASVTPVASAPPAAASKPQKRRNRNNPLRHYKRRKKKSKLGRIKIKPAVSSSADGEWNGQLLTTLGETVIHFVPGCLDPATSHG